MVRAKMCKSEKGTRKDKDKKQREKEREREEEIKNNHQIHNISTILKAMKNVLMLTHIVKRLGLVANEVKW